MLETNLMKKKKMGGDKTVFLSHWDGRHGYQDFFDEINPTRHIYTTFTSNTNQNYVKFGQSALYIDNNGCVRTPDSPELRMTGEWTIEFWALFYLVTDNTWLLSKGMNTISNCLKTFSGNLYLQADNGYGLVPIAGNMRSDRTWQHFAITGDGTNIRLYIDGVKKIEFADTGFGNNTAPLSFGGSSADGSSSYAQYDETRISRVLRYTGDFTPPDTPFTVD
jgi:hypothetical protein